MSLSYVITVVNVLPSYTELADTETTILRAESSDYPMMCDLYEYLAQSHNRVRLEEVKTETHHRTLRFKKSIRDNPFVT